MGILMAGLSPHPPLIIPEIGGDRRSEVQKTITNLEELAGEIKEKNPDLLITISPHGPVFKDSISVLNKERLRGDFGDFGHPEVSFTVDSCPDFIDNLKEKSRKEGIEVLGLDSDKIRNYNVSAELDHGVLVPLYFIRETGLDVPIVALTMGLLPYKKLYNFGLLIQKTLADMEIEAVIVASGDLSHRLKPGAPAGYNPRGQEFDEKLVSLLAERKWDDILHLDPALIKKAGECGLRPIIILIGSLRGIEIRPDVKSYEGPFGVGYAVAGFYPEEG